MSYLKKMYLCTIRNISTHLKLMELKDRLLNARISVYASSRTSQGQDMPLTEFMALGKQYAPQITAYRTLKASLTGMKEEMAHHQQVVRELEPVVAAGYNPLLSEAPQEFKDAQTELRSSQCRIEELAPQIENGSKTADKMKRSLPAATLSGTFYPKRGKDNLVQHSGFMAVDVDDHVNHRLSDGTNVVRVQCLDGFLDFLEAGRVTKEFPWVVYASHSVGGRGYFCLIPIGMVDEQHTHEWYFECIAAEFERYGYTIDPACSDVSRLRILSYDNHPFRNAQADTYLGRRNFVGRAERQRQAESQRRAEQEAAYRATLAQDPDRDLKVTEQLISEIERRALDVTGSYDQCIKIGRSLHALGEHGLWLWKRVCRFRSASHSQMRTDSELEDKWKTFGGSSSSVGLFWQICDKEGVRIYSKKQ